MLLLYLVGNFHVEIISEFWDSCVGVFEALHKATSGRFVWFGKQWEELNLPLGKVFVRNIYHLFYICFLSLWLLNICTGNRGQRCLPSLKWNQYLFISGKWNTFSCTFVQCASNFHYRGIVRRAKQYCAYPKDVSCNAQ